MYITDDIFYIGVNDHQVDLFEGQYRVPNGMAYNSYVIRDEKIAVLDTVDHSFGQEWLDNLSRVLEGREPDYLVIHHMEPDHGGSIGLFVETYPNATIVSNAKAFVMMDNFFPGRITGQRMTVQEGSTLSLGKHSLTFVTAPMVHWPEVMVSYESKEKILFSADAFGKFGALDAQEPWDDEARRYYIGIVGKYGPQATALLKKAAGLDISMICATHGPVLKENLGHYINKYLTWASYAVEDEGIVIAYSSIYGNTKKAALLLEETLRTMGASVVAYDLARDDMAQVVAQAFRYSKLVLAAPTYNGEVFPHMRTFLSALVERNFRNRTVGFIENGSWAPRSAKVMQELLEKAKDLTYCNTVVTVRSALNEDSAAQIKALAEELAAQ